MPKAIDSSYLLTEAELKSPFKVYAGPGAGKTYFLVHNISRLLDTQKGEILAITYTNAAADEWKERIAKARSQDPQKLPLRVSTIHSFVSSLIVNCHQEEIVSLMEGDFGIEVGPGKPIREIDEDSDYVLSGADYRDIQYYVNGRLHADYPLKHILKTTLAQVEVDINAYADTGEKKLVVIQDEEAYCQAVKAFEWDRLRRLTHDETLYFGYRILETHPDVASALARKYPRIFVDEFQDTSPIQTLILKLLAKMGSVVGVVGDVCQSIYSFQGAKPSDFLSLSELGGKPVTVFSIPGNRRSTANVVGFCDYLRRQDADLVQTSIRPYPDSKSKEEAEKEPVHFLVGDGPRVGAIVDRLIAQGAPVLTRTWGSAFDYLVGIGKDDKYYLNVIYRYYRRWPYSFPEEVENPKRLPWVIGFALALALRRFAQGKEKRLGELALSVDAMDERHRAEWKRIGEGLAWIEEGNFPMVWALEELYANERDCALLRDAFGFPKASDLLTEYDRKRKGFLRAFSNLSFCGASALFEKVYCEDSRFMTVHQAKGREWDDVLVAVFPVTFDQTSLAEMFQHPTLLAENDPDEFARIYYVACSRAKHGLYVMVGGSVSASELKEDLGKASIPFSYEIIQ